MTLTVNGEKNPETLQLCVFGHGSMAIGLAYHVFVFDVVGYAFLQIPNMPIIYTIGYYTSYSKIWGQ